MAVKHCTVRELRDLLPREPRSDKGKAASPWPNTYGETALAGGVCQTLALQPRCKSGYQTGFSDNQL